MTSEQKIVPGIVVTADGQAVVAPELSDVLFDLALQLEDVTNLPVDVEHVLGAVVLASQSGQIEASQPLVADDAGLLAILSTHVTTVFERYGGVLGADD